MSDEPTWAQRKAWNNDGMDPDWRPETAHIPEPPQYVPLEFYDNLKLHVKQLENLLTQSKNEIRDRWAPSLENARKETAQMQHDMMGRHEKFVMAMSKAKELQKENEALLAMKADLHRRLNNALLITEASEKDVLEAIDHLHAENKQLKESVGFLLNSFDPGRTLSIGADGTTMACTCGKKNCHVLNLTAGDQVMVVPYIHSEKFKDVVKTLRRKV